MNTKKCDHQKDCKNGYHTKGTVVKQAKDQKKEKSDKKVDNQPKVPKAGVQPIHTASKLTIVSKFYHIVRKKCDNFRVRYK
jgi:hypothetical protein